MDHYRFQQMLADDSSFDGSGKIYGLDIVQNAVGLSRPTDAPSTNHSRMNPSPYSGRQGFAGSGSAIG